MNVLGSAVAPFQWIATVRHRRVFHPNGVLATGSIERVAADGAGLPIESAADVLVRISKGIGMPGALPDVSGLALRLPPNASSATPWDVLLASAAGGPAGRMAVRPAVRWSGQSMSSVMPLRYAGANWWLRARISTDIGGIGVSLDSIRKYLRQGHLDVDIDQARGWGPFRPLARLTVNAALPSDDSDDVAFEPVLNVPPGVQLVPHWLAALRKQAYRDSRHGRQAD